MGLTHQSISSTMDVYGGEDGIEAGALFRRRHLAPLLCCYYTDKLPLSS
jgi:hypothetical protein